MTFIIIDVNKIAYLCHGVYTQSIVKKALQTIFGRELFQFVIIFSFTLYPIYSHAQMNWDAFAEDYIFSNDENDEQTELIYEQLHELHLNPIDLNTATADALLQIPFIDEKQATDIIQYRDAHFPIRTMGELMFVSSLSRESREILQLFCYAGTVVQTERPANIKELISHSRNEFLFRTDLPFYTTVGQEKQEYRGNGTAQKFRYALQSLSHLYAGVQAEKDAGERGIDYISAYVMLKDIRTGRRSQIRELIVGNYRASFGLGLAINNGISFGKNVQNSFTGNIDRGFSRHSSFMESNYLTGAALRYQYGNVILSAYGAYNKPDANYTADSLGITSLKTDGLHRTELEYSKRHNLTETNFGANIHINISDLQLSATIASTHYSVPLAPRWNTLSTLYRKYNSAGQDFQNYSIAYAYTLGKFRLAGETALSHTSKPQNGFATLDMLQYKPNADNTLQLIFRHYWAQYTTIHGRAFGENSRPQNEQGILLSWSSTPTSSLNIYTYIDFMRFPWLKSGVLGSSYGIDYTAQAIYSPGKRHRWLLNYHIKSKQKSYTTNNATVLQYNTRQTLKLQHTFTANQHLTLTTTANGACITFANNPTETGYSLSENIRWTVIQPNTLRLNLMLTYMNTDSYNARIYSYEPSLLYSYGMQPYYYHALRGVLMTDYSPIRNLTLTAKFILTKYMNRDTIGSGRNLIHSSVKSDLQLQLRYKL